MKKMFRILLWIIVAAIFVGSFVFLYLNSREKKAVYENVSPEITTLERTTVLTGTIEPRDEINIKPQISGIITEILVEPGDKVKEGDIIARIKVIPEASSLSSAQNRVDLAQIKLTDARTKYDRARTLFDKKVIAREEYETAVQVGDPECRSLEWGRGLRARYARTPTTSCARVCRATMPPKPTPWCEPPSRASCSMCLSRWVRR